MSLSFLFHFHFDSKQRSDAHFIRDVEAVTRVCSYLSPIQVRGNLRRPTEYIGGGHGVRGTIGCVVVKDNYRGSRGSCDSVG